MGSQEWFQNGPISSQSSPNAEAQSRRGTQRNQVSVDFDGRVAADAVKKIFCVSRR